MSTSDPSEFGAWLTSMVAEHGEFTVLVILVELGQRSVSPLCSTYFHVIGDEVTWDEITAMLAGSGQAWSGVAFFPTKGRDGGPIDNPTARLRMRELEERVMADRMTLNDGHFFDAHGRRIEIAPES